MLNVPDPLTSLYDTMVYFILESKESRAFFKPERDEGRRLRHYLLGRLILLRGIP